MYFPNQEIDWNALALSITTQDCILLIGPDAIREPIGHGTDSLMRLFSQELIKQLPEPDHHKTAFLNPAQVAQVYKRQKNIWALRAAANEFFGSRMDTTTPYLKALAGLPFRLVIDTTPVRHMEQAFEEVGKKPLNDWYHKNGPTRNLPENFDDQHPLVYHIFGFIKDLKSLVLAETELVDLIVSVISGNPPLPPRLLNAFSKDCSMLFLGFGVRHLALRILLHILNKGWLNSRSFALEHFDDNIEQRAVEGFKLLFKHGRQMDFIDMELDVFAEHLCSSCRNCLYSSKFSSECTEHHSRRPLVFMSYCRENESTADHLRRQLEDLGVDVWRDVDNLEAGEEWYRTIKQVIGKANSFVLLLSKKLYETREGVVVEELSLALERKRRMTGKFIMPILIDDHMPEEDNKIWNDINSLHIVDSRTEMGLRMLVTAIKREFQTEIKTVQ